MEPNVNYLKYVLYVYIVEESGAGRTIDPVLDLYNFRYRDH